MPDAVLLDWQMPIMGGIEFLKLLRAYVGFALGAGFGVLVGLGDSTELPAIRVYWPDGHLTERPAVAIDRVFTFMGNGSWGFAIPLDTNFELRPQHKQNLKNLVRLDRPGGATGKSEAVTR